MISPGVPQIDIRFSAPSPSAGLLSQPSHAALHSPGPETPRFLPSDPLAECVLTLPGKAASYQPHGGASRGLPPHALGQSGRRRPGPRTFSVRFFKAVVSRPMVSRRPGNPSVLLLRMPNTLPLALKALPLARTPPK